MAEGEFHESLNLAALWRLPVLFVCENNLYAMGTALSRSESQTNLPLKASSYAVPAWTCDGMDVLSVWEAARRATALVRDGGGPVFLEALTYRFRAHSMYDADRYRSRDEVAAWRARDPLPLLGEWLRTKGGVAAQELEGVEHEVKAEVDDAVAFARAGADESVDTLLRWVTSGAAS